MRCSFPLCRFIALGLLLFWGQLASAQSRESHAIEFEADSIRYDSNTGSSLYRGNVSVRRGGLSLQGDEVEVFSERGEIRRVVSRADPGIFLSRSAEGEFRAEAERIEYDVEKKLVLFSGDVKIYDGGKTLEGSRVVYDLEKKTVSATESKGRVRLKIDH